MLPVLYSKLLIREYKGFIMANVYLDALITREDFEAVEDLTKGNKQTSISCRDLDEKSFFYPNIRKPDFQRETNEWTPELITGFIKSFVEGNLIPAVILWRNNSGLIFVIDGAHRLSSLIAWINDDYGDGPISKAFYGDIPDEQKSIAEKTRKLVRDTIGTYKDLLQIVNNPDKHAGDNKLLYARNLGILSIQLQWVEGNAEAAEQSFFKINQKAVPIDTTEIKLLKSRKKPNCIAARAILRGSKGHNYWSLFTQENQQKISELSNQINNLLFSPPLKNPIKTLDLPIAGKNLSTQTLALVLDYVNIVNDIKETKNKDEDLYTLPDDTDGSATIDILKNTLKMTQYINSNVPCSLGLHPAVYFYSQDSGRHKITSFYAITSLIKELVDTKKLPWFIKKREKFENFILEYEYVIQQINRRYRIGIISYPHMKKFYLLILEKLHQGKSDGTIIEEIINTSDYNYITLQKNNSETENPDFSSERKSSVFLKTALQNAVRCKICNGLIHINSISIDHIQRKENGGTGDVDNGQLTHPYCNTAIKN